MSIRTIGFLLMVGGAILLVISLVADLIGLGSYPGLNWAQLTGAAVGLVVLIVGVWLTIRNPKTE